MELSEVLEVSYFEPPPKLHLGLTGRGSLQHPENLNWIGHFYSYNLTPTDTSTPTIFDQFVTITNVRWPSTYYFVHCNICLNKNFFLNKINKTTKLSQTFSYFSFSLFYADCQFIQGAKEHLQKHFVLYFRMCYFETKKY